MKKVDLKKQLKHLYAPSAKEVVTVKVPRFNFLMIDGAGDPNTSKDFQDAVQALYGMSYTLKFLCKKEKKIDCPVMALEGLWWMKDDMPFDWQKKEDWRWTLMIMQPKHVTKSLVKKALKQLQEKKNPPALGKMRFESFAEGACAQIMHIGPYANERPTIEKIFAYIKQHGQEAYGRHHEIYLGDPRKSRPEKLKTVIRMQVRKLNGNMDKPVALESPAEITEEPAEV
jgi:hypothetical protein